MLGALKYGAIGIGLVVLTYTAQLLRQELKRHSPRPEARNLITIFMLFSLAAFCIATYIELREKAGVIAAIASSMDSNLGGKFEASVRQNPDHNLLYFTDQLCIDVRNLKAAIGVDSQHTTCRLHGRPDPNP